MKTYGRYRRARHSSHGRLVVASLIGAVAVILIGAGVLWMLSQPSTAELRDEADYADQCEHAARVTAEFGPQSRPAADAEYQKARTARIFSERYGRRPQYQPPGQRAR